MGSNQAQSIDISGTQIKWIELTNRRVIKAQDVSVVALQVGGVPISQPVLRIRTTRNETCFVPVNKIARIDFAD